jgi:uncharacterized phage protein gp47/JayE
MIMPDYGVTTLGFVRKSYEDVVASMEARARSLFGDDIDLAEGSPVGDWNKLNAFEFAENWELAEDVYHSGYAHTADGESLNGVAKSSALKRRPATKAIGVVRFTGEPGSEILQGTFVSTANPRIQFRTTTAATVGTGGTVDVAIEAIEAGSNGNLMANAITEIINPASGITAVTNPEATTVGRDIETDAEFRDRVLHYPNYSGGNMAAIQAEVINPEVVPGILDVTATFSRIGIITPISFVWEDGTVYQIDKILDARCAASPKTGSVGNRYTCQVRGKPVFIWLEDDKWFMERKN